MKAICRIPTTEKVIFLTFDDGPSKIGTSEVLDLLLKEKVEATFFVVAQKAQAEPDLLARIQREGHAIGNHSLDHRYSAYFGGIKKMQKWIQDSQIVFASLGIKTIGFRPPAGVRTPPLYRALDKVSIPMILWNVRFFDAVFPWTQEKARRSLAKMESGSVILLHDVQREKNRFVFLETLFFFIREAKKRGFVFRKLTPESFDRDDRVQL